MQKIKSQELRANYDVKMLTTVQIWIEKARNMI